MYPWIYFDEFAFDLPTPKCINDETKACFHPTTGKYQCDGCDPTIGKCVTNVDTTGETSENWYTETEIECTVGNLNSLHDGLKWVANDYWKGVTGDETALCKFDYCKKPLFLV